MNSIPYVKAKALVEAHKLIRQGNRPMPLPGPNGQTKWIWFSMESIQKMLDVIGEHYRNHGKENIGIKFYLAKYENEQTDPRLNEHLTLVMTPAERTQFEGAVVIRDHGVDLKGNKINEKELVMLTVDPVFQNWGNICPPFCDPPKHSGDAL